MRDFKAFRAEVKKRLCSKEWTYADLAANTGYSYRTIERFMGKSNKDRAPSEKVAVAIAQVLGIPEHMTT